MKWKSLVITCIVCLLPILLGISLWSKLPNTMAIHFNVNNRPDNFASKGFVVFGLPILMMVLQTFCCFINDINAYKHGERRKFTRVTKWIIPIMAIILQTATLGYGLGWNIDIRRLAVFIVGVILLVIGNYLPKFEGTKMQNENEEKARKIQRFIGYETVVMGILFFLSLLFPPVVSLFCLFLFVPYAIMSAIYGIKVGRER